MKFLLLLIALVLVDNGCSESKIDQDLISVEYTALSRGFNKHIIITNKSISVTNKRGSKPRIKTCSKANWSKLIAALKPVDIKNIPNLEAPSQDRFFDGAAIARLKVVYKDVVYETPSFDHGNPHQAIAALVKDILSISENME